MDIVKRLERVKYQALRFKNLSDKELVNAVRSIYDAAIKSETVIPEDAKFPLEIMGVSIKWSQDKKTVILSKGAVRIEDNLIDTYVPEIDKFENFLSVNDDFLFVNGKYLSVSA